ncbi:NAD(P)-binding domain-containing protein [Micrococcus luteus]
MSSSEAAPADALPRVVGILGAGRAGTALARAIARIPRLSPGTAAPRVMVAGTRRPAAVQRHLTIYAPKAVAVSAEDLAAEAELVVVAVPREALDDVDPLALAGPATRAVVDLTNTWGDEPVPAWLDDDGAPGSVRIAARWAAAGLCVPVVRAFSEISHHDLEDAGRATAPRRALAVGTEPGRSSTARGADGHSRRGGQFPCVGRNVDGRSARTRAMDRRFLPRR